MRLITAVLLLGLSLTLPDRASLAQDQVDPVELSVVVLDEGAPVFGAVIDVDGFGRTPTNRFGAALIKFPADPQMGQTLSIFRSGLDMAGDSPTPAAVARLATTQPGEQLQIIVALGEGLEPIIDIESSVSDASSRTGLQVTQALANPGRLLGVVVSTDAREPVAGARVFVSGNAVDIRTDQQGQFTVDLNAGTYSLSVLHAEHSTQTVHHIEVLAEQDSTVEIELTPAGLELPEFVVLEPYIEGSLASLVDERRGSTAVTDVLGAEQISKAGDSDAASALKRVTGLTLVDGKFIYVRGLGERYSSTLVNGAAVPSPDPTRRVIPLDLFPTDVLEAIIVQKTFSPSMPGEFGGGTVQLRTRGIPEGFLFKLGGSLGYTDGTTGERGLRYQGGDRDRWGFDDGSRAMPASMQQALGDGTFLKPENPFLPGEGFSAEQIEQFGEDLSGVFDITPERLPVDFGSGMSLGNRFDFDNDVSVGFLTSVRYDQSWDNRFEVRRQYRASDDGLVLFKDFDVQRTLRNIELSGFFNLGVEFGDDHSLLATTLYTRLTEDEARITEGFDGNVTSRFNKLQWTENELFGQQLLGKHVFEPLGGLRLDWLYTTADATLDEPMTREYRYDDFGDDGSFQFSLAADNNVIRFSELEDNSDSFNLDLGLPIEIGDNVLMDVTTGGVYLNRDRQSSIRRFKYNATGPDARNPDVLALPSLEEILTPDRIGRNGFVLSEVTRATDAYFARQKLEAAYANIDLTLWETIRLSAGARNERNLLSSTTFAVGQPDAPPVVSTLDEDDILPAAGITWFATDDSQLRFAYSETLSRPEFRELSPAAYTDPVLDAEVVGNPELITANITNYDLRWETYFSPTESVSVALFYKQFTNPIEVIRLPGSGVLTLDNALGAENYGIEAEVYKELGFLTPWLDDFYTSANVAWIESEIELTNEQAASLTSQIRALQGQSPYVVNFQFGYDNDDKGREATLLFNLFGDRISQVGVLGAPDIFEESVPQLDFVFSQAFADDWKFKLKLKNILDPTIQFTQGTETTRAYKKGLEVSVGLEWKPE